MSGEYRFEYRHFRPAKEPVVRLRVMECRRYMRGVSDWEPHECGGVTICHAYNEKEFLAMGLAFCSMKDNFSYRLGREIAKGRALASIRGESPKMHKRWSLWGDQFLWGGQEELLKMTGVIGVSS